MTDRTKTICPPPFFQSSISRHKKHHIYCKSMFHFFPNFPALSLDQAIIDVSIKISVRYILKFLLAYRTNKCSIATFFLPFSHIGKHGR